MEIIVAKNIGFCGGVRRAVNMAIDAQREGQKVFTWGDIIHNEVILDELKEMGINSIDNLDLISKDGTLIIRAHGIGKELNERLSKLPITLIDATCPNVKKIHKIVNEYHKLGYKIVIFGKPDHPEVIGINGWCENQGIIIQNAGELDLPFNSKICLVAHTTSDLQKWNDLKTELVKKYSNLISFETICQATIQRQREAMDLASNCDVMIVIGGKKSSNTQKLINICNQKCNFVVAVSHPEDLEVLKDFKGININENIKIGVVSGASTPRELIDEIVAKLK